MGRYGKCGYGSGATRRTASATRQVYPCAPVESALMTICGPSFPGHALRSPGRVGSTDVIVIVFGAASMYRCGR